MHTIIHPRTNQPWHRETKLKSSNYIINKQTDADTQQHWCYRQSNFWGTL